MKDSAMGLTPCAVSLQACINYALCAMIRVLSMCPNATHICPDILCCAGGGSADTRVV
jgi:hypothetical protein